MNRRGKISESTNSKMADVKSLEHPTLKVPYEILNKKFRTAQKTLDREVAHVQQAVLEIEKGISGDDIRTKDISTLLGGMVEKLQVLKRKAEESIAEELQATNVCKRRIDHLKEHGSQSPGVSISQAALNQWKNKRLDRMVVEYFLRNGYYNAAIMLAEKSCVKDLTNIDIFLTSWEVEKSLANHETSKCLTWCHDNRSKLRKLKSNMEFNLRVQEFVELIRSDRRIDAIKHSRKHFPGFEEEHLGVIQQVMALLAFPVNTDIVPYKALFDESRWDVLIEQFRQENCRLFQLVSQSVFTVALQAGFSALKTPQCYRKDCDSKNPGCPICQDYLNKLAENLPFAHCSQSRLFCHISGLPLNENNQPMMLPNGFVYGEQLQFLHCVYWMGVYLLFYMTPHVEIEWDQIGRCGQTKGSEWNSTFLRSQHIVRFSTCAKRRRALEQMASDNNGQIICPRTKDIYPYKKVEKVYVM